MLKSPKILCFLGKYRAAPLDRFDHPPSEPMSISLHFSTRSPMHSAASLHRFFLVALVAGIFSFALSAPAQWVPPCVYLVDPNKNVGVILSNTNNGGNYAIPAGPSSGFSSVTYQGTEGGSDSWTLVITSTGSSFAYSYSDYSYGSTGAGTYDGSALAFTASSGVQVTPTNSDGSAWPSNPFFGPPAIWVQGTLFQHVGTVPNVYDLYGDQSGDLLNLNASWFSISGGSWNNVNGSYNGLFSSWLTILPANADGSVGTSSTGLPVIWVSGNPWTFNSDVNGTDYFVGAQSGQSMMINGSSATIADPVSGTYATGTYSNGVF